MMTALSGNGTHCSLVGPQDLEARRQSTDELIWIDFSDPTTEDFAFLRREFTLHELVMEDLIRQNQRPKLDEYDDFFHLVFHGVDAPANRLHLRELHVLISDRYLLTVHRGTMPEVAQTQRRWQNAPALSRRGTAELLYVLLDAVVDGYFPAVDQVSDRVDSLETRIVEGSTENIAAEILALRRHLMIFRRILAPEREVVNALLRHDLGLGREQLTTYYQDLYDHINRIIDQVDTFREMLGSLLDTHLATTSYRLNNVMKRMTAYATILMSVTLISSIYGMNFQNMPELSWPLGYAWALGLMGTIALILGWLFRREDWL